MYSIYVQKLHCISSVIRYKVKLNNYMTIPKVAVDGVPTVLSTREAPASNLSRGRGYPNEGYPQLHIQIVRQCLETHQLLNVTWPMQMKSLVKLVQSQTIISNSSKYCGRGRTPRKSTKWVKIIMKYVGSNARGSNLKQRYVTDLDIKTISDVMAMLSHLQHNA